MTTGNAIRSAIAAALVLVGAGCGAPGTQAERPPAPNSLSPVDATILLEGVDERVPVQTQPSGSEPLGEIVVSDTIFPPPNTAPADYVTIPYEEMEEISLNAAGRRTVAIERRADDTVVWWLTAWSSTSSSGDEVYCLGSSAQGVSCRPDLDELVHPVRIAGFSTEPPAAVVLIAKREVTALAISVGGAPPREIALVPMGLTSGKQLAGIRLDSATPGPIRLEILARLEDGDAYNVAVDLPAADEAAWTGAELQPTVNALNEQYAPIELLTPP